METLVEQRHNTRTDLAWPVNVWMPQANRFFNGQSDNISKSGVLIALPATTPVKAGFLLEMNFPRTEELAQKKGSYSRLKMGKVVRVERENLLSNAKINVAVQFV